MASSANCFDALRLIAAWSVLASHQFALMGRTEPAVGTTTLGHAAVGIFFAISGYLVTQSWQREPDALRFLWKRALRIWPGLVAVTAFGFFLIGPWFSNLSPSAYFFSPFSWDFWSNIALIPTYRLPGVFDHNPLNNAVNGSLWTIPYEAHWYLIIAGAGTLGLLKLKWLLPIAWMLMSGHLLFGWNGTHASRPWAIELGAYFLAGACLYIYRDHWHRHREAWLCGAALLACAVVWQGSVESAWLVIGPLAAIWFGESATPGLHRAGALGDPTYGIYLYAYPVQQALIAMAPDLSVTTALFASTLCTVTLAYASWHGLEKKALRLKNWTPLKGKEKPGAALCGRSV